MKKRVFVIITLLFFVSSVQAQENIRRIGTWNMKWLGTNSGNQLDPIENVPLYANIIKGSGTTLFALQEIGATHSISDKPRCFYLDQIVDNLNVSSQGQWVYILDQENKNQRLAFFYRQDLWQLSSAKSIYPGKSFKSIRKPFLATVQATGTNARLKFQFINIHFKAFPDSTAKRKKNFEELTTWIGSQNLDTDVLIAGDTNLYKGEETIYKCLQDISYVVLDDPEITSIHSGVLSQKFDRFFCSPGLANEISMASEKIGKEALIDVLKDDSPEKVIWFDQNISDHYPVVVHIDVSEER